MSVVNQLTSPFQSSVASADAALAAAAVNTVAAMAKSHVSSDDETPLNIDHNDNNNNNATATAKKTFYCKCCNAYFSTGFNLRRHMHNKHRDDDVYSTCAATATAKNEDVSKCCEDQCDKPIVKCVRPIGSVQFLSDDAANLYVQFQPLHKKPRP